MVTVIFLGTPVLLIAFGAVMIFRGLKRASNLDRTKTKVLAALAPGLVCVMVGLLLAGNFARYYITGESSCSRNAQQQLSPDMDLKEANKIASQAYEQCR